MVDYIRSLPCPVNMFLFSVIILFNYCGEFYCSMTYFLVPRLVLLWTLILVTYVASRLVSRWTLLTFSDDQTLLVPHISFCLSISVPNDD